MATAGERILAERSARAIGAAGGPSLFEQASNPPVSKSRGQRILEKREALRLGVHEPSVSVEDRESRKAFFSDQLELMGQKNTAIGPPGFEGQARFDMGLSDTFEEKQAKFLSKFPDGEFLQVFEPPARGSFEFGRGGSTFLFKTKQDEEFREFDAQMFDEIEVIGDLNDLSGDIPAMIGEAILSRGRIIPTILGAAAGTIVGDTAKEALEIGRGFGRENFDEASTRIFTRAGFSGVGAGLGSVATGPINAIRGGALISLRPGATQAQAAASRLGVDTLTIDQVANSPILQRLGKQSRALVSTLGDYVRRQEQGVVRSLRRLRDTDALRFIAGDLREIHDEAVDQITGALRHNNRVKLDQGGNALRAGLAEYEELSGAVVDSLYKRARNIETPEFDIAPLLAVADDIKLGQPGPKKPSVDADPDDVFGNFTQPQGGDASDFVQLKDPHPAILKEIERLEELDPALPDVVVNRPSGGQVTLTATDHLRAVRSNLFLHQRLPIDADEPARRLAEQATKLGAAIDHVLKNPKNASPEFLAAWKAANTEAAKRFSTLEIPFLVKMSQSEHIPRQLVKSLARKDQADNLDIVYRTFKQFPDSEVRFRVFQDSVMADFLAPQNINKLTQRLDDFDKETLDLLIPPAEQPALRQVGVEIDRLNQANIIGSIRRQEDVAAAIGEMVDRSDSAGRAEFVRRLSNMPAGSPQHRMVRAGIIENFWNRVTVRDKNVLTVNPTAHAAELKRLKENGVFDILPAADRQVIEDVESLASFLPSSADAGTSQQAASATAGIRGLTSAAAFTIFENIGTGRALTNPAVQRILIGKGRKNLQLNNLKVLGAILGLEADSLSDEADEFE